MCWYLKISIFIWVGVGSATGGFPCALLCSFTLFRVSMNSSSNPEPVRFFSWHRIPPIVACGMDVMKFFAFVQLFSPTVASRLLLIPSLTRFPAASPT